MNQIDQHKLIIILQDSLKRLGFLGTITTQDDISSELAGYEISKLLEEQTKLEKRYAELVQLRSTLLGITNKNQLKETQEKVTKVAQNLKESTKKLCRLFKENPDLEKDAQKVKNERRELIVILEDLMSLVQNNQLTKFQNKTTSELQQQDQLRQLIEKEKILNQDIKRLQLERQQEYKDYQNEINEKNQKIQNLKEKLLFKRNRAQLKKQYDEKEAKAKENTLARMYEFQQKQLQNEINNYNKKIETEELVHKQLKNYLQSKEEAIKQEADMWNKKHEKCRQDLDDEILRLTEKKQKDLEELEQLRNRNDREMLDRQKREREELEEQEKKRKEEEYLIRLDNAIKLVQAEYQEWKDAGGGKKKKRGGGKKKKK